MVTSSWRHSPYIRAFVCPGRGFLFPYRLVYLLFLVVSVLLLLWVGYGPSHRAVGGQDRPRMPEPPAQASGALSPTVPPTPPMGVVPLPCIGFPTPESDLLTEPVPEYEADLQNPCWYERLYSTRVYARNKYAKFSRNARKVFETMTSEWEHRLTGPDVPQRLRCLPYFFLAGQPKCGSTDLYFRLTSHPDVVTTPMKEPHWWGKNRFGWRLNFTSDIPLSDYTDLFDQAALAIEGSVMSSDKAEEDLDGGHQLITGDGSVSTFWDNDDWWRLPENCGLSEPRFTNAHYVYRLLPQAKIIVIFRDPVDRLWSDYLYFQKTNKSADNFHHSVLQSIRALDFCTGSQSLRSCLYNRTVANTAVVRLRLGVYWVYLEDWLRVFPREQLLLLRLEDYAEDTASAMERVFDFLGLRQLEDAEEQAAINKPVANTRRAKDRALGSMRPDTRRILQDFYRPHNLRLASLLKDVRYMWSGSSSLNQGPEPETETEESLRPIHRTRRTAALPRRRSPPARSRLKNGKKRRRGQ